MRTATRILLCLSVLYIGCGDDDGGVNNNNNLNTNDNTNQNNNNTAGECGDGTVDTGEDCDNGTANSDTTPDACREDCTDPSCGDNVTDTGEECDDGNTTDGDGCSQNCVTESTTCGDNTVDTGEVCDDGNTTDGDGCSANCLSDETCGNNVTDAVTNEECDDGNNIDGDGCQADCQNPECGDDIADPAEDCDGTDLDSQDCTDHGFAFGDLDCTGTCGWDLSGCHNCGNDTIDASEVCDGTAVFTTTCGDVGFTGGTLACNNATCGWDTSGCTNVAWPTPGEVIVTEVMQNPDVLSDGDGEWFEVYNTTSATLQLQNCTVEGNGSESFLVDDDLLIAAGAYAVFSVDSTENQGFTPDFQYPTNFYLGNGSDTLRLVCDGSTIDEINWDGGTTFPDPTGASMNLDPSHMTAVENNDGTNWCEATTSYNGDLGTPGAANDTCPVIVNYTIDFCRLQSPMTINDTIGTTVDVYGRLYIAGLTDNSGVNDPASTVMGWVGYGPDGSDPATSSAWVWEYGAPNAGYDSSSPGYEANNDEYMATLTLPGPADDYDYAFRFSGDGGSTYTYCDGDGNAYDPADAGQMTTTAGATSNLYFSEYIEGGSNNKAVEIYNAESTAVDVSTCVVSVYSNGNTTTTNHIALTGSIAVGDVFVVCHSSIDDNTECDVTTGSAGWNGDDAVELSCGGVTLDVIGQIGFRPSGEWNVGGVGTADETLRRVCTVTTGDNDGSNVFDPSAEFTSHANNDLSDLGSYTCP